MKRELKKRLLTSIVLLSIFFLMFFSNLFLIYIVIIFSVYSLIEFSTMNNVIFIKSKFKKIINNLIFIIYLFLFSSFFILFSFTFEFKLFLFFSIIICILTDIGGFIFGKFFKGPLLTKISPNKTVSGSIGSFLFSISFTLLILHFFAPNLPIEKFLIVATSISLASQLGDLFFSLLKRKSGFKDTGKILPGHGGILDRIDGILFGLPFGMLVLIILFK